MMNPSQHAIRRPFGYLLVIILASLIGIVSAFTIPIRYLPELGHDQVAVSLNVPGLAVDETQRLLAEPVEDALLSVPDVDDIRSISTAGRVEFVLDLGNPALSEAVKAEVRDRLSRLQANVSPRFEVEAVFSRSSREVEMSQIAVLGGDPNVMAEATEDLRKRLSHLADVERVQVDGMMREELVVLPDPAMLLAAGLTQAELADQIRANSSGDRDFDINPSGTAASNLVLKGQIKGASPEALSRVALDLPSGGMTVLGELARIKTRSVSVEGYATLDGAPAVLLSVYAGAAADLAELSELIDRVVEDYAKETGIVVTIVDRRAETVLSTARSTLITLLEGIVLIMVIVWVSLRSVRSVMLAGLVVPLTILPSLFVMQTFGFSLNIISMMALALAVGIVIDDAIVELENIHRHMVDGETVFAATQNATRRIGRAVIATTLAVVAVFVPVTVLPGMAGRYFQEFGGTFVIAALASLFVVRTVLPPLAARFALPSADQVPDRSSPVLARALDLGFRHPVVCLLGAGTLVILSVLSVVRQTGDFIPADDTGRILVSLKLPAGEDAASERTAELVGSLSQLDGVRHAYAINGSGDDRLASLVLVLDPRQERALTQAEIEVLARDRLLQEPGLRFRLLTATGRPGAEIVLRADDPVALRLAAERLIASLKQDPALRDVAMEGHDRFNTSFLVDPVLAQSLGVDPSQVGATLSLLSDKAEPLAMLGGNEGEAVPLRIGIPQADAVRSSLLRSETGGLVPLGHVVLLGLSITENEVIRENGAFVLRVSADRIGSASAKDVRAAWRRGLEESGIANSGEVSVLQAGDQKQREKMVDALMVAGTVGLLVLAATLFALFRSAIDVMVVMVTLPFAIGGAAVGLALSGQGLSLPVLLALLLLLGIVAKNAILILDEARARMDQGCEPRAALRAAALLRAKAVVMTSAAVIFGMAPAMIGMGEGAGFRQPMAIAVSAGIAVSTVTSLVLVPVLASLLHGWTDYVKRSVKLSQLAEG